MTPMTPMDAQLILDGAEASGENLNIGYRRALETIAGMREEYRTEYASPGRLMPVRRGKWTTTWPTTGGPNTRIVRRYVTEPEEA